MYKREIKSLVKNKVYQGYYIILKQTKIIDLPSTQNSTLNKS